MHLLILYLPFNAIYKNIYTRSRVTIIVRAYTYHYCPLSVLELKGEVLVAKKQKKKTVN